jgi:hypothetical protein
MVLVFNVSICRDRGVERRDIGLLTFIAGDFLYGENMSAYGFETAKSVFDKHGKGKGKQIQLTARITSPILPPEFR